MKKLLIMLTAFSLMPTTILTPVSCGQKNYEISVDKEQLTLNDTDNRIGIITITNFKDLVNVTVNTSNPAIATCELKNNQITVTAQQAGTAIIMISADNISKVKNISVTVNQTKKINVDKTELNIYTAGITSGTITITNFALLTNVQIKIWGTNPFITATLDDKGKISIQGNKKNAGIQTLEISAAEAPTINVKITVSNGVSIELSTFTLDLYTEGKIDDTVQILNYNNLKNFRLEKLNNPIIGIKFNSTDGSIAINQLNTIGAATLTMSADNADPVDLIVNIKQGVKQIAFNTGSDTINVDKGNKQLIKILNFSNLVDVKISNSTTDIAIASLMGDEITITGIDIGQTQILVSATNSNTAIINVNVT